MCDKLGASRVFVFDHNVRNATREGLAKPSRQVHNDHTVNSAPRRVRDHMGAEAEELSKHRFGIVNVWRPIHGPVQDSPLALRDAHSFTDGDLIDSDLVYAHVRGETSRVAYNPAHRWYYFSDMQPDKVLLIWVHDSDNDGRARLSFQTSFDNPLTPGALPRESIEVRTLVFVHRPPDPLPEPAALRRAHRGKAWGGKAKLTGSTSSGGELRLYHWFSLSVEISGAGLVMVDPTAVAPAGRISQACLGLYSDANAAALARAVALCRRWAPPRSASNSRMPATRVRQRSHGRAAGHLAPIPVRGKLTLILDG